MSVGPSSTKARLMKLVEEGTALELFENPQDDYTRGLLAAVPVVRPWLTETP